MAGRAFLLGTSDAAIVATALSGLGFTIGPPHPVTTTVLDTFDGRLHRAGLRLEFQESTGTALVLSGPDTVAARLEIATAPRVPGALPPGPFRSRLERLTGLRSLLPQLEVTVSRRVGVWRDADGKIVTTVHLDDDICVVRPVVVAGLPAVLEIYEVSGYAKRARRVVDLLEGLGLSRCADDVVAQWAAAAGVDLGGYVSTATVPLEPDLPAVDGYRAVLAHLAGAVAANWQGTIDRSDTEFLHDLRIAVRRSRTVLGEAKDVLPAEVRAGAREGLAWIASLTGPPRDLDVYLLEWNQYVDPLGPEPAAALAPVRAVLERRCDDAHAELEGALQSTRAADLMESWTSWLAAPLDDAYLTGRAMRPLGKLVAKRIARAHAVVIERGRLIDPLTPAEHVHDLRKDAKKLRYLLECFGTLFPGTPRERFVKRLRVLQDNLGEYQDAEVHVAMLRGIAHELHDSGSSTDTTIAIGQLTERLDQQRLRARGEFAERFEQFDTAATRRALQALLDGTKR